MAVEFEAVDKGMKLIPLGDNIAWVTSFFKTDRNRTNSGFSDNSEPERPASQ